MHTTIRQPKRFLGTSSAISQHSFYTNLLLPKSSFLFPFEAANLSLGFRYQKFVDVAKEDPYLDFGLLDTYSFSLSFTPPIDENPPKPPSVLITLWQGTTNKSLF